MNRQKGKVAAGGQLQLPPEFCRAMGIADGDVVVMEMKDGDLVIRSFRNALARAQQMVRRYVPEGVSLADELIADRRTEAERE